jgi:hypothetical protein
MYENVIRYALVRLHHTHALNKNEKANAGPELSLKLSQCSFAVCIHDPM